MKPFSLLWTLPFSTSIRFAAIVLLALNVPASRAGTSTWIGGGGDGYWTTTSNWDVPPSGTGEQLVFTGFSGAANTNDFGAGAIFGGITFSSPAGAFVLRGNPITLSGGITNHQEIVSQTIHLPLILNTNTVMEVTSNGTLAVDGGITGSGFGLVKSGGGRVALGGDLGYTGNTIIGNGALALTGGTALTNSPMIQFAATNTSPVLDVSGRTDARLTLVSGQTLEGNGVINGNLTVNAGATLSPGQPFGTLTVSNDVILNGTTLLDIHSSMGTNAQIIGADITYGGTLTVSDLAPVPTWGGGAPGQSFKLFSAASYHGAFTTINLPTLNHYFANLVWSNSLNIDGRITVVVQPPPPIEIQYGTNVVIQGVTSSQLAGVQYRVVASSNLALPIDQWTPVYTGTFASDGSFICILTNAVTTSQRFFCLELLLP